MKHVWRFGELLVVPSLWATCIFAAISLHGAVLVNDHSLCGPWGCGPASDAILAIHLAWIAAIWPPLLFLPWRLNWNPAATSRLGLTLASIGLAGVIGVCSWQWFVWRPEVSESIRPYIWQRCGFVLAGAVDWPIFQLFGIGTLLWTFHTPSKRSHNKPPLETAANLSLTQSSTEHDC